MLKKVQELERGDAEAVPSGAAVIKRCVGPRRSKGIPWRKACRALHISRAGYYQWRSGKRVPAPWKTASGGTGEQIHKREPGTGIPAYPGRFWRGITPRQ